MELLTLAPAQRPRGERVFARIAPAGTLRATERAPFASTSDSIFVGRERELATLQQAFARVRAGNPLAIVVEAESGVGKTSLVRRFIERARAQAEPMLCFSGRCFERESLPYKALDDVMDAVCRHLSPQRGRARRLAPESGGGDRAGIPRPAPLGALATDQC